MKTLVLTLILTQGLLPLVVRSQDNYSDNLSDYWQMVNTSIYNNPVNSTLDTFMLRYAIDCNFRISKIDTTSLEFGWYKKQWLLYDENNELRKSFNFFTNGSLGLVFNSRTFGNPEGIQLSYREDGSIAYISTSGMNQSISISYRKDKSIQSYIKFDGVWQMEEYHYYPSGALSGIRIFNSDRTFIQKEYREFGQIESAAECGANGYFHGKRILYNKKGKPKKVEYYENNVRVKRPKK
jgi:antitoxin component YwqK of YwqJK toxin-antitoxin module